MRARREEAEARREAGQDNAAWRHLSQWLDGTGRDTQRNRIARAGNAAYTARHAPHSTIYIFQFFVVGKVYFLGAWPRLCTAETRGVAACRPDEVNTSY